MPLNYVGYWEENGYTVPTGSDLLVPFIDGEPVDTKLLHGKAIPGGVMWGLLTRYRMMNVMANIIDDSGRPIVVLHGKKLQRVLELGCDYGHAWSCFRPNFEEVYGAEISSHADLGKSIGNNIERCSMDNTPFEDDFFDVVISTHVLEHGENVDPTLAEIYRVTKPNGWSAHSLPCTTDNKPEGVTHMHRTCLGYKTWKKKFVEHGFTIIRDFFLWAANQEDWVIIARKVIP